MLVFTASVSMCLKELKRFLSDHDPWVWSRQIDVWLDRGTANAIDFCEWLDDVGNAAQAIAQNAAVRSEANLYMAAADVARVAHMLTWWASHQDPPRNGNSTFDIHAAMVLEGVSHDIDGTGTAFALDQTAPSPWGIGEAICATAGGR